MTHRGLTITDIDFAQTQKALSASSVSAAEAAEAIKYIIELMEEFWLIWDAALAKRLRLRRDYLAGVLWFLPRPVAEFVAREWQELWLPAWETVLTSRFYSNDYSFPNLLDRDAERRQC